MELQKIIEEQWSFILYKANTSYYLTVICGEVGMYEINFKLNSKEEQIIENKIEFIKFVHSIQANPHPYIYRNIDLQSI